MPAESVPSGDTLLSKYVPDPSGRGNALRLFLVMLAAVVAIVLVQTVLLEASLQSFANQMIWGILFYVGLLLLLLGFFRIWRPTSLQNLGLTSWQVPRAVGLGLLSTAGFPLVMLLFLRPPAHGLWPDAVLLLAFCLLVAFVEEIAFRGYIFHQLRQSYHGFRAWLFTAVYFGLLHLPKYVVLIITSSPLLMPIVAISTVSAIQSLITAGLAFSALRYYASNLCSTIAAHFTWNFYILLFEPTFSVSDPFLLLSLIPFLVASLAMDATFFLSWPLARRTSPPSSEMLDDYICTYKIRAEAFSSRAEVLAAAMSPTVPSAGAAETPVTIAAPTMSEVRQPAALAYSGKPPATRRRLMKELIRIDVRWAELDHFNLQAQAYWDAARRLAQTRDAGLIPGLQQSLAQTRRLHKLDRRLAVYQNRLGYFEAANPHPETPTATITKIRRIVDGLLVQRQSLLRNLESNAPASPEADSAVPPGKSSAI